jgi:uncharacterized protein YpmS
MTDIGRSRRIWRRSFFVLLGVSVAVIAILFAMRTDRKVSYAGESQDAVREDLAIVSRLLEEEQPPTTRSTVLKVLRRENPRGRILATDSTVAMGDLIFVFGKNGRLQRVQQAGLR